MKAYMIYLMKTKWLQTLVLVLIPTLIVLVNVMLSYGYYYYPDSVPPGHTPTLFVFPVVLIMLLIPVTVILRFWLFRNSKDIDLYYSLPISRRKLYLSQLLFGVLQLILTWTVMYLLSLFLFSALTDGYFFETKLFMIYLVILGFIVILYAITQFFFLQGNTIVDGIVFIALFHVFLLFISAFLTHSIFRQIGIYDAFMINPFYALSIYVEHFLHYAVPNRPGVLWFSERTYIQSLINTLVYFALGVLFVWLSYTFIHKEKTEHIGRISHSLFGYRLLVPLTILFATASIYFPRSNTSLIGVTMIVAAGFIGFFIYRRSVKIKWIDVFSIIIPMLLGMLTNTILQSL